MKLETQQSQPLMTAEQIAENQFQDMLRTFQHIVVKTLTTHDIPCVPLGEEVH